MAKKKKSFSVRKEVRAIARERVGPVKAGQVIKPKSERKSKYKNDTPDEQA
jgi:ribosomal protein S28E/S33